MSGAIPPLFHYAFIEWCSVKAQGQLYFYDEDWPTDDEITETFKIINISEKGGGGEQGAEENIWAQEEDWRRLHN